MCVCLKSVSSLPPSSFLLPSPSTVPLVVGGTCQAPGFYCENCRPALSPSLTLLQLTASVRHLLASLRFVSSFHRFTSSKQSIATPVCARVKYNTRILSYQFLKSFGLVLVTLSILQIGNIWTRKQSINKHTNK